MANLRGIVQAPAVESSSLTELDCWRASTILDMLELKLLKSVTMLENSLGAEET